MLFANRDLVAAEDTLDAALALYGSGAFADAAETARQDERAESQALTARALLAEAVTNVPFAERLPILEAAEAAARRAIAKDDRLVEGHLQLAIALGYIARFQGPLAAQMTGMADEASHVIAHALALEPTNPWALATSGGWHLEIVRRTPVGLGKLLFGASRKAGIAAFETALAADPDNILIRYEYALSLCGLDTNHDRARAIALLKTVVQSSAPDAFAMVIKARAERLLGLFEAGKAQKNALQATIRFYMGEAAEPRQSEASAPDR